VPGTAPATTFADLPRLSTGSAGERVALAVDVDRLHFFDPETEAAIS
jgi:hypothetical protein